MIEADAGPLVSLVICAFNAERFLGRALESARAQTYKALEILVIDDASSDGTLSLAEEHARADVRVRCLRLTTNGGIAHARQVGLENARGQWIAFLDADDVAAPAMIEKQVAMTKREPDVVAVATFANYFEGDEANVAGEMRVGVSSRADFDRRYRDAKLVFMPINTLYERKAGLAVGGYRLSGFPTEPGVRFQDYAEDLDLWCRLSDLGASGRFMVTIPEPLLLYRKTTGSLSTTSVFRMQEKMRWIKECLRRRRNGRPEISFEDYRHSLGAAKRLSNWRRDCAAWLQKRAGFYYLRGQRMRAIFAFGCVALLDPRLAVSKLRTQRRGQAQ